MGSNGPAPHPTKYDNLCLHCGRDNAGIDDKTCRGCGAVVLHRPTSPQPPRPDTRSHKPNVMAISGLTPPPPPPAVGVMYR
jgi:hypothetical protein